MEFKFELGTYLSTEHERELVSCFQQLRTEEKHELPSEPPSEWFSQLSVAESKESKSILPFFSPVAPPPPLSLQQIAPLFQDLQHKPSKQRAKAALAFLQAENKSETLSSSLGGGSKTEALQKFAELFAPAGTKPQKGLVDKEKIERQAMRRGVKSLAQEQEELEQIATYEYGPFTKYGIRWLKKFTLSPHQERAIDWRRNITANPPCGMGGVGGMWCIKMGLGKTPTAYMLMLLERLYQRSAPYDARPREPHIHPQLALRPYPSLVVCPKLLVQTWKNTADKFFGKGVIRYLLFGPEWMTPERYKNITFDEICRYDVVITNYETIVSQAKKEQLDRYYQQPGGVMLPPTYEKDYETWLKEFKDAGKDKSIRGPELFFAMIWSHLFLDESQRFANSDTWAFLICVLLKAYQRTLLTGTPYRNKGEDIYSQIRAMGFHGLVSPQKWNQSYYVEHCLDKHVLSMDYPDAGIPMQPLHNRVIEIQRTEEELKLRNIFIDICGNALEDFECKKIKMGSILGLLIRMRQEPTAAHMMLMDRSKTAKSQQSRVKSLEELFQSLRLDAKIRARFNEMADWLANVKGTAGWKSGKNQMLLHFIQSILPMHRKLVVTLSFTSGLEITRDMLRDNGIQCDIFSGELSEPERNKMLKDFDEDPDFRVLLLSLKAGSVGLNLQVANFQILFDTWWTPAEEEQAMYRIYRMDQVRPAYIVRFLVVDSIESSILKIGHRKKGEAESWASGGTIEIPKSKQIDILRDWIRHAKRQPIIAAPIETTHVDFAEMDELED